MKCLVIASFAFVTFVSPCTAGSSFVGRWNGTAGIDNVWAHDKKFPVALEIHRDGSVSGSVGEAKLVSGRFRRWRPVGVGRKASGDMMDYMITGKLTGFIIPAEHIAAANVYIPLDVAGETLDGGLNAHGTVRGAEKMNIMSCDLTLSRVR